MDVRQVYREAQSDLIRYQGELATIQQRVAGLLKIVEGLRVLDPDVDVDGRDGARQVGAKIASPTAPSPDSTGDHRQSILSILKTANTFMSTQEIAQAMLVGGFVHDDREATEAVRKVISRMSSAGQLIRERRDGRSFNYGLLGMTPQNAESPVATTELSVVPAPTREEGRTADVSESGDRSDHLPGWNDSDGRGAPSVMEG